jgi:hypothetical protein
VELPVKATVGFAQVIVPIEVAMILAGSGFTNMFTVYEAEQIPPLSPITVYVVFTVGLSIVMDEFVPLGNQV